MGLELVHESAYPEQNVAFGMDQQEVVVVGGSFAGLSAALYLARARRRVLVLDSGAPRNRFAAHSRGVFALDGRPGSELLETARSQLASYSTARFVATKVRRVSKAAANARFEVETEDRMTFECRRVILATGLVDEIPGIPGMEARWGTSVFHCPYCDGYELGGGPIGVLATLPLSVHLAKIITDWGKVTLFTNGTIRLDASDRAGLSRNAVDIEEGKVAALEGSSEGTLDYVHLSDGRKVEAKALFIATLYRQAAPFASELGCELVENPRGILVKTDESKMTTVPGVYATGDMARLTHSIPFATSDGVTAGVAAHQSLIAEEHGSS